MKNNLIYLLLTILLIAGFLVRLYKIDNPVADWHSWRQADTSAVTRNFVKYGINILYPIYDDLSDVSGTGKFNPNRYRYVEFPLFNLLHYSLYSLAGSGTIEYWGRMTSVLAAVISGGLIFFLIRRHAGLTSGLVAAGTYLLMPFNIYFTRVILPDPLMVTLFLFTLNFYDLYENSSKKKYLILTCIFGALSVLVKPIAIFFLLPITISLFRKSRFEIVKNPIFYLLNISFLLPFGIWRVWSSFHPEGIPASNWLLNGNGIRFKPSFFQWMFGTRLGTLILGKFAIWPFIQGIIKANWYVLSLGFSALLYITVFATGNVQHDYYQIPTIPAVSALIGIGVAAAFHTKHRRILQISLSIICLALAARFAWLDAKGLYQINNWPIVRAGQAVNRLTPKDSVVIAPYQGDTAFLYQTNRPGFAYPYEPIKDLIDIYSVDYYISVTYDTRTREIMDKYTVVEENPEYVIVKLIERLR